MHSVGLPTYLRRLCVPLQNTCNNTRKVAEAGYEKDAREDSSIPLLLLCVITTSELQCKSRCADTPGLVAVVLEILGTSV